MAKILFRLRMVPDDEADEVRDLLDEHHIPWFETSAGRFGVSFPAIWLSEDEDWVRARQLLDDYQQARKSRLQADQEEAGTETFVARLFSHPVQIVLVLCAVAAIAYFSVFPFFSLLQQ